MASGNPSDPRHDSIVVPPQSDQSYEITVDMPSMRLNEFPMWLRLLGTLICVALLRYLLQTFLDDALLSTTAFTILIIWWSQTSGNVCDQSWTGSTIDNTDSEGPASPESHQGYPPSHFVEESILPQSTVDASTQTKVDVAVHTEDVGTIPTQVLKGPGASRAAEVSLGTHPQDVFEEAVLDTHMDELFEESPIPEASKEEEEDEAEQSGGIQLHESADFEEQLDAEPEITPQETGETGNVEIIEEPSALSNAVEAEAGMETDSEAESEAESETAESERDEVSGASPPPQTLAALGDQWVEARQGIAEDAISDWQSIWTEGNHRLDLEFLFTRLQDAPFFFTGEQVQGFITLFSSLHTTYGSIYYGSPCMALTFIYYYTGQDVDVTDWNSLAEYHMRYIRRLSDTTRYLSDEQEEVLNLASVDTYNRPDPLGSFDNDPRGGVPVERVMVPIPRSHGMGWEERLVRSDISFPSDGNEMAFMKQFQKRADQALKKYAEEPVADLPEFYPKVARPAAPPGLEMQSAEDRDQNQAQLAQLEVQEQEMSSAQETQNAIQQDEEEQGTRDGPQRIGDVFTGALDLHTHPDHRYEASDSDTASESEFDRDAEREDLNAIQELMRREEAYLPGLFNVDPLDEIQYKHNETGNILIYGMFISEYWKARGVDISDLEHMEHVGYPAARAMPAPNDRVLRQAKADAMNSSAESKWVRREIMRFVKELDEEPVEFEEVDCQVMNADHQLVIERKMVRKDQPEEARGVSYTCKINAAKALMAYQNDEDDSDDSGYATGPLQVAVIA